MLVCMWVNNLSKKGHVGKGEGRIHHRKTQRKKSFLDGCFVKLLRSPFSSRHVNGRAAYTAEPCGRLAMQNVEKMFNEKKGVIKKAKQ